MSTTAGIAGLFYDSQARRLGPLLRGHLPLFDRKEAPTYSATTGLRLLAIFVLLELVVGPRFSLFSWLGLSPPPAGLRGLSPTRGIRSRRQVLGAGKLQ